MQFAHRMSKLQKSFIREILKVTENPEVISFAGGLPNPNFFPVQEIAQAAQKVLQQDGQQVLQYSTTEGYGPLREWIARRYDQKAGLTIDPAEILITNGSQQGLDLIGKVLLNPGDVMLLEEPGYLGAIQAFSLYEPAMQAIPLLTDGLDIDQLAKTLSTGAVKLLYTVPNFQNPSGLTYSLEKRQQVAQLAQLQPMVVVEDDPYGELRFSGHALPPIKKFLPDSTILLGSFSKVVSPGMRLGWICAPAEVMEQLIVAKQASDLHSNYLSQRIVYQYLQEHDLDDHLVSIKTAYKQQRDVMVAMLDECLPPEVTFTRPEGGMFVWVTLPAGLSAIALFEYAAKYNVVFVPGQPFYLNGKGDHSFRLNFSNSTEAKIETGITRLTQAMQELMNDTKLR